LATYELEGGGGGEGTTDHGSEGCLLAAHPVQTFESGTLHICFVEVVSVK